MNVQIDPDTVPTGKFCHVTWSFGLGIRKQSMGLWRNGPWKILKAVSGDPQVLNKWPPVLEEGLHKLFQLGAFKDRMYFLLPICLLPWYGGVLIFGLFIHSLIQKLLLKHLPCSKYCIRCYRGYAFLETENRVGIEDLFRKFQEKDMRSR